MDEFIDEKTAGDIVIEKAISWATTVHCSAMGSDILWILALPPFSNDDLNSGDKIKRRTAKENTVWHDTSKNMKSLFDKKTFSSSIQIQIECSPLIGKVRQKKKLLGQETIRMYSGLDPRINTCTTGHRGPIRRRQAGDCVRATHSL
jgi:hypothetical protein